MYAVFPKIMCYYTFLKERSMQRDFKIECAWKLRPLKVVGNEKIGRSGRSQMLGHGPGPWRSRFILNMQFLSKKYHFRFRLLQHNE